MPASRTTLRWCSPGAGCSNNRIAPVAAFTGTDRVTAEHAAKTSAESGFFAPCPRGLEAALAGELTALGASSVVPTEGGAGFSGDLELAYRTNLESRLASRVLW